MLSQSSRNSDSWCIVASWQLLKRILNVINIDYINAGDESFSKYYSKISFVDFLFFVSAVIYRYESLFYPVFHQCWAIIESH